MPLIEALITAHNFDIICLPETFLDSSKDISDTRININGYSQECIVSETTVRRCFLTWLYGSTSQNDDKLERFCSNPTFSLANSINRFQPSFSLLLRDFNTKHSKWCSTDKNDKGRIALGNIT